MTFCSDCGIELVRAKRCKKCYQKKWQKENEEKCKIAAKKWKSSEGGKIANRKNSNNYAAKNRESEKIKSAKWRKENPEKAKITSRNYYLKNKESVIASNRLYRSKNIEIYRLYGALYRGKKRSSGGYVHPSYVDLLFSEQGGRCACCDVDFSSSPCQIDHVEPISKGGVHCEENLQLLCEICNKRKSDRKLVDFLKIIWAERC